MFRLSKSCLTEFQSTSSARRTTELCIFYPREARNFNPRPPRGGRRQVGANLRFVPSISIHVLREEDDNWKRLNWGCLCISIHVLREEDDDAVDNYATGRILFQSTSSARRTTSPGNRPGLCGGISIHVLREEDDSKSTQKTCASFAQKVQSFPRRAM